MTNIFSDQIASLLELAQHYPSPHNGQPIRIEFTSDSDFTLYFQKERGLQATEISFIFSFVSMGVFVQHLLYSAQALGHGVEYVLKLPKESSLKGDGAIAFAYGSIEWNIHVAQTDVKDNLLFRQTSRRKYTKPPKNETIKALEAYSSDTMKIVALDQSASKKAVWLNQRAVFDDLFDEPVRQELDHWLRYSRTEKEMKKDGLSYDCMQINGPAMRYIVNHPWPLRLPGISWLLKEYYLRTMSDESRVLYMLAPFRTEQQSFDVGMSIMKLWYDVSEAREYLHPFGTIMSNEAAHRDFLSLAGISNETRDDNYLVFIFRLGISEPPVPSMRLSWQEHLLMNNDRKKRK